MWIVVGAGSVAATFGNGFSAFHHEGAAGFSIAYIVTGFAGWTRFDGVFAVRIIGTTIEWTETTALLYHLSFAADGTDDAGCVLFGIFLNIFAFWIV